MGQEADGNEHLPGPIMEIGGQAIALVGERSICGRIPRIVWQDRGRHCCGAGQKDGQAWCIYDRRRPP
jgi:hypothetical protein